MDLESLLWALVSLGVASYILSVIFEKKPNLPPRLKPISDLPCPPGVPILGNLLEIVQKGYHICHIEWLRTYGKMFRFNMGPRTVVMVCDSALIREFSVQRFKVFHDRPAPPTAAPSSSSGLLFAKGEYWAGLRTALTSVFHQEKHLHRRFAYMTFGARQFMEALKREIKSTPASPPTGSFLCFESGLSRVHPLPPQCVGRLDPTGSDPVFPGKKGKKADPSGPGPVHPGCTHGGARADPRAVNVLPLLEEAALNVIGMTCFGYKDWMMPADSTKDPKDPPKDRAKENWMARFGGKGELWDLKQGSSRCHFVEPCKNRATLEWMSTDLGGMLQSLLQTSLGFLCSVGRAVLSPFDSRRNLTPAKPSEKYAALERMSANLGVFPQLVMLLCPEFLLPFARAVLCSIPGLNISKAHRLRTALLKEWERKLRARMESRGRTPRVHPTSALNHVVLPRDPDGPLSSGPPMDEDNDLVDGLCKTLVKGRERPLTLEEQTMALFNIIGGGSGTSSAVISSTLHFLAKYPDTQQLVAAEIEGIVEMERYDESGRGSCTVLIKEDQGSGSGDAGGRGKAGPLGFRNGNGAGVKEEGGKEDVLVVPLPEMLPRLQYLDWVVKESLRLCPPGGMMARVPVKDTYFGGYFIPAGTPVVAPVYALHLLDEYFPRATEFLPERFREQALGLDWGREIPQQLPSFRKRQAHPDEAAGVPRLPQGSDRDDVADVQFRNLLVCPMATAEAARVSHTVAGLQLEHGQTGASLLCQGYALGVPKDAKGSGCNGVAGLQLQHGDVGASLPRPSASSKVADGCRGPGWARNDQTQPLSRFAGSGTTLATPSVPRGVTWDGEVQRKLQTQSPVPLALEAELRREVSRKQPRVRRELRWEGKCQKPVRSAEGGALEAELRWEKGEVRSHSLNLDRTADPFGVKQEKEHAGPRLMRTMSDGEQRKEPAGSLWNAHSFRAYLPFGAGPRMCVGQRYGMVEVKLFLFLILHKYEVALGEDDSGDLELAAGINLKPKGGVRIVFRERNRAM